MSDGISPTDWPSNRSVHDRRAEIDATITLWVGNQRLDAALKAAELGALSFLQKAVVMRNGLLISCIKHCRMNPRAEAKIPILIMIMFLADNTAGICYLGVMRMAEIFQRTKTCIINNIAALEADGLIGVNRKDGLPNCYWPLIPAALAEMSANPIWFVDALSTKPKSRIFKTPDEAIAAATEDGNLSTLTTGQLQLTGQLQRANRSTLASEPVNCSVTVSLLLTQLYLGGQAPQKKRMQPTHPNGQLRWPWGLLIQEQHNGRPYGQAHHRRRILGPSFAKSLAIRTSTTASNRRWR